MAKDQRDAVAENGSSGSPTILPRSGLLELKLGLTPIRAIDD